MSDFAKRQWRGRYVVLLALSLAMLAFNLISVLGKPPNLHDLKKSQVTLIAPIRVIHPTGKGTKGPSESVQMQGQEGSIDTLYVWMQGSRIWQLEVNGQLPLSYENASHAFRDRKSRSGWIFGVLNMVTFGIPVLLIARKKENSGDPSH